MVSLYVYKTTLQKFEEKESMNFKFLIEVVSFKTSDNRTFYALKDEAKEEQKKKGTTKWYTFIWVDG